MKIEKFILKYFDMIRTVIAVLIGVMVSVLVIYIISKSPGHSLMYFLTGPFMTRGRIGNLLETATPILFGGLAVSVPFQASQFNVGQEGAIYLGAALGTAFALSFHFPAFMYAVIVLIFAGLIGAGWGYIPGILKAKWKVDELVSSLMMNYVAYFLGLYVINYHFRDKSAGFLVSYELPHPVWLKQFIPGTRIHLGIILAVVFAFLVYYFLYHTKLGYEIRMTGFNLHFAKYGGINTFKVIVLSQVIGGFIAGVGGMVEVMGIHHRFNWQMSPGYGWDGVVVAIIGHNHPLLIILASLFLAYLRVGGQVMNLLSDVPSEMVTVIESIIILLITAEAFLSQWKYRITVKQAALKEVSDESAT